MLLVLVTVVGCGGDDEPAAKPGAAPKGSSTPSPTAAPTATPSSSLKTEQPALPPRIGELRTAVQAFSNAYFTGDVVASRALLSDRCKLRVGPGEWAATVKATGQRYGNPLRIESYDAQVSGDLARVTYTYADTRLDQSREPWVRGAGGWRNDDC